MNARVLTSKHITLSATPSEPQLPTEGTIVREETIVRPDKTTTTTPTTSTQPPTTSTAFTQTTSTSTVSPFAVDNALSPEERAGAFVNKNNHQTVVLSARNARELDYVPLTRAPLSFEYDSVQTSEFEIRL